MSVVRALNVLGTLILCFPFSLITDTVIEQTWRCMTKRIQTSSQPASFPSSNLFLERTPGTRLGANGHRCYRCWCNKRKRSKEEKVVVKCSRRPHNGKTCNFMSWKELKRLWNVQKLKLHVKSVEKYCFSLFNTLWFVTFLSPSSSWLLSWLTTRNDQIQDFAEI